MTTNTNAERWASAVHRPMGFVEFLIVIASIMALNPLAMDVMLPALPDIGAALHVDDANRLQVILSTFMLGFGIGQFFVGPVADRFGRRPVVLSGMALYVIASALASVAPTFETLLLARMLQGLSTSATRVIATSIVRDCYVGRRMASVMSLAQMVFISVPILAPSFGQLILSLTGTWHSVFIVLLLAGIVILTWNAIRLPETLAPENRKSLAVRNVLQYYWQTINNRQSLGYALAAGSIMGAMFTYIFSAQQVLAGYFQLGPYFTLAFAANAVGIALAAVLNARFVGRFGMRGMSHAALLSFVATTLLMMVASYADVLSLALFIPLAILMLFSFGLLISNFTALAMEPHGQIAGTASSLFGSVTTLSGSLIGYLIGQSFNGTLRPLTTGFFVCGCVALLVVIIVERGRLFHSHRPVH